MGGKILAALLLTVGVYLALQHCATAAPSTSEVSAAGTSVQRARVHSFPRVRARLVPLEPSSDLLSDFIIDDEFADFNKRQSTDGKREKEFDDYGHMRFGKREQFDDYGHMRFGRSLD